ncbi:HigA family addiction module antitoxin [Acidithiobacillus sp. IBUN Pt1247-S3]|uniref:HigA family addiction module antitoxin n=1 Tax=Acidithiobacillus sp. IBUN Pt1247-S3 TaxID=3166642 RepID=UPI0034E4CABC
MSKKLKPIHPGEQLREEFMLPLGLSSNALARALHVTPARVNEIVRERRGISADTALRLARFFNTSHHFWLNLQSNYDVQCAEDAAGEAISHIQPWQGSAAHATSA